MHALTGLHLLGDASHRICGIPMHAQIACTHSKGAAGAERLSCHAQGSHPKGRNVFLRDMEPFLKWLDEAEEDEDEE